MTYLHLHIYYMSICILNSIPCSQSASKKKGRQKNNDDLYVWLVNRKYRVTYICMYIYAHLTLKKCLWILWTFSRDNENGLCLTKIIKTIKSFICRIFKSMLFLIISILSMNWIFNLNLLQRQNNNYLQRQQSGVVEFDLLLFRQKLKKLLLSRYPSLFFRTKLDIDYKRKYHVWNNRKSI